MVGGGAHLTDPGIGPDGFRIDGLVDDTDEIDGPAIFGGPAGPLLEEIRVKLFDGGGSVGSTLSGEPRTQVVYERLAEFFAEQAEEGSVALGALAGDGGAGNSPSASSTKRRLWRKYLQQTLASVEKRAKLVDANGAARVIRAALPAGGWSHVELLDWKGRRRVRVTYGAGGVPVEVLLVSGSGEELRYTEETFAANSASGGALGHLLEAARVACSRLRGASPQQVAHAKKTVEDLCVVALPRLEGLLRRELEEGRQLVPTSEDLLEMDAEEIIALLEKG